MVQLGKSKLPLEEDLIKRPIEFVRSWLEFAAGEFEQVVKEAQISSAGNTTIFTVPNNFTFFLTNVQLSSDNKAAVGGDRIARVATSRMIILSHIHAGNSNDHIGNSFNFPMPLKFNPEEVLLLSTSNSNLIASANIIGFLVSKRIS